MPKEEQKKKELHPGCTKGANPVQVLQGTCPFSKHNQQFAANFCNHGRSNRREHARPEHLKIQVTHSTTSQKTFMMLTLFILKNSVPLLILCSNLCHPHPLQVEHD